MLRLSNSNAHLPAFIFSFVVLSSSAVHAEVDPQESVHQALSQMTASDNRQPWSPPSNQEKSTNAISKFVPQTKTIDPEASLWSRGAFALLTMVSSKNPFDIGDNMNNKRNPYKEH